MLFLSAMNWPGIALRFGTSTVANRRDLHRAIEEVFSRRTAGDIVARLEEAHCKWPNEFRTLTMTEALSGFSDVTLYAPFLAVAIALGAPPALAALVLAFFSSLFASLTHYVTAPAPILFGSGHVSLGTWWKTGLVVSAVNIAGCRLAPRGGKSSGCGELENSLNIAQ